MTEEDIGRPECFRCGNSSGENDWREALVKIYSNEVEDVEIVDGKRDPSYTTRGRWCCISCLFTAVASNAFENGLDYAGVEQE